MFTEAEDFIKRARRRPLWAFLALAILGVGIGGSAWLSSFFSEKGKLAAEAPKATDKKIETGPLSVTLSEQSAEISKVAIDGLAVGRSATELRVDIALRNASDLPVHVTSLEFRGSMLTSDVFTRPGHIYAHDYTIADVVAVPSEGQIQLRQPPASGDEANFTYPVHGNFSDKDGEGTVLLEMESAAQIPQRSLSRLSLLMPIVLNATRASEQVPLDLRKLREIKISARMSGGETYTRTLTLEVQIPYDTAAAREIPKNPRFATPPERAAR